MLAFTINLQGGSPYGYSAINQGYTNVIIEIDNESNIIYQQPILRPERVHELVEQVKQRSREGRRLLVSTSFGGGFIPTQNVVAAADFILVHGNRVEDPNQVVAMMQQTRALPAYHPMPILFNEDDHFNFDQPWNNMVAAVSAYASWGYFDYRMAGEGFNEGYQSVPVNWTTSSERKRGFYNLLKIITSES